MDARYYFRQYCGLVCTLCSCYPWTLLGIPPGWYKSDAYRARAVREPQAVLAEFGVVLGAETAARVWDSTSEIRYLVIPERPPGTEGWAAEALAALVTRDSMIGAGRARAPARTAHRRQPGRCRRCCRQCIGIGSVPPWRLCQRCGARRPLDCGCGPAYYVPGVGR